MLEEVGLGKGIIPENTPKTGSLFHAETHYFPLAVGLCSSCFLFDCALARRTGCVRDERAKAAVCVEINSAPLESLCQVRSRARLGHADDQRRRKWTLRGVLEQQK